MIKYDDCASTKRTWTEDELREYIEELMDDINHTEEDITDIKNKFVYDGIPVEVTVSGIKHMKQMEAWNTSKHKRYYRVDMSNGGSKFVYMCAEQVKCMYPGKYKEV